MLNTKFYKIAQVACVALMAAVVGLYKYFGDIAATDVDFQRCFGMYVSLESLLIVATYCFHVQCRKSKQRDKDVQNRRDARNRRHSN